ncbi:hypothetical protein HanIR_Chr06g0277851 [Helianthus annuus]|nr:hypothetical protein HanIR_Chr06g0277851 [Helianthus annuus]
MHEFRASVMAKSLFVICLYFNFDCYAYLYAVSRYIVVIFFFYWKLSELNGKDLKFVT